MGPGILRLKSPPTLRGRAAGSPLTPLIQTRSTPRRTANCRDSARGAIIMDAPTPRRQTGNLDRGADDATGDDHLRGHGRCLAEVAGAH
eukprot:3508703-Lingulodinium_polyedra.AAC.1